MQGTIEHSNVEPIIEMTKMIEVVRAYQAVTKIMDRADELSRRAIRAWARFLRRERAHRDLTEGR